jgi:hypothetical protein
VDGRLLQNPGIAEGINLGSKSRASQPALLTVMLLWIAVSSRKLALQISGQKARPVPCRDSLDGPRQPTL